MGENSATLGQLMSRFRHLRFGLPSEPSSNIQCSLLLVSDIAPESGEDLFSEQMFKQEDAE